MNKTENTNSSIKELAPYILLQPHHNRITIGKDIVKSLGYPKYVCLRINEKNNSFAIFPCDANDVMSFKVPERLLTDHRCVFRLHSKQFLTHLTNKYNLDESCVYGCKGIYSQKLNAVIVSLSEENLQVQNQFPRQKND